MSKLIPSAYDGSGYHGWQRQASPIVTVQQTLEEAIVRVVKHPLTIRGSGRTDTGVHAAGQVANFVTTSAIPDYRLHHAINTRLPKDIRVLSARNVDPDFDSIASARGKLYRYVIHNHEHLPPAARNYCYHYYHNCSVEPMRQAAAALTGSHDFASFASAGREYQTSVRNLFCCEVWQQYHRIYFDFQADGFLYHMVRNIVGTLLEIGRGRWQPDCIPEILAARARAAAGPMAPPNGLTLQWVRYD